MSDSGMVEKSSLASERERFEEWAKNQGYYLPKFEDDYLYSDTKGAWAGWQAASAGRQELLEALEGLMELERRGRLMPIGREWDAARAAIAKATGEQQ